MGIFDEADAIEAARTGQAYYSARGPETAPAAAAAPPAGAPAPIAGSSFGDQLRNFREGLSASTSGIVRGLPIVGPLLERGVEGLAAAPAPLITGESPVQAAQNIRADRERIAAEHPIATGIGETTGGVVGSVAAGRALPITMGGRTLAGQTLAGGTVGGADAAIRSGGDPDAIRWGAGFGAAGPTAGRLLAPAITAGAAGVRGVTDRIGLTAPKVIPMAGDAIERAAEQTYNNLSRNTRYDPAAMDDLRRLIARDLYNNYGRSGSVGARDTIALLRDMDTLPNTPGALHTMRKALREISGGDEGHSARFAIDRIDQFLEAPPPRAVIAGRQNAATVGRRLQEANADYRAAMNSRVVREGIDDARADAAKASWVPLAAEGDALRNRMNRIATSSRDAKYMRPEDVSALEDVSRGNLGERVMRGFGRITGTGRPGVLTGVLAATGAMTGNPLLTAAVLGAGGASSIGSSLAARQLAEHADRTIRASSPSAQRAMRAQLPPRVSMSPAIPPPSLSPNEARNEIARVMALQGSRAASEPERDENGRIRLRVAAD